MSLRILVVDDDDDMRVPLRLALEEEGHTVSDAPTGEIALDLIAQSKHDVVILDLTLPGLDGFEVCRRLRSVTDVPVIMVTARADSHDVVAGLEAGADDYVTKPFVPKELSARIRALMRRVRSDGGPPETINFGEIELAPDAGTVRRAGNEVALTRTEFLLLCELAASRGRVLSREQLLDRVWGYDYVGDGRLVDVHVRRLRRKVEPDPSQPAHIVTVRGLGYKLQS